MEFLSSIEFWHWWVLALVLGGIEIFAPGFIFIWLGLAAGAVGLVLLLAPNMSWELQLLLFGLFSVVSVLIWWRFVRGSGEDSDQPSLNRRANQYVGRTATLDQPIVNGVGMVRLDDSRWKVLGPDLPLGTVVRVIAAEGATLRVEAQSAEAGEPAAGGKN
ncbi:NfeD family protein [Limibacillus sp. MBR-115]|jgi:membrane protein implicated in regulation of membrane protease activity|uniref:NfeD family protein n=1 Tax=Limibacillus sp. MBR-115 TaxID=3156465 RepID=UPI00339A34CA